MNLTIIAAAIRGRRILRHNYVYAYVTCTLSSNVAFGLTAGISTLMNFIAAEEEKIHLHEPKDVATLKWWAFRKSLILAVYLIMSASIASLIYGLRESSYFIGKFSSNSTLSDTSTKRGSLRTRKQKAVFIILLVWLIPCLFSIVPPIFDECIKNCQCHPGAYLKNVCNTTQNKQCSAIWVPLSKSYLICVVVVWLFLIIDIGYLLSRTIVMFLRAVAPSSRSNAEILTVDGSSGSEDRRCAKLCFRGKWPPMNHSIKLLISLSATYTIFTLPAMVVITIDIANAVEMLDFQSASIMLMLALAYAIVSPVLLVKYMPGLRKAVADMFSRICRTTNVTRRRTTVNSVGLEEDLSDQNSNAGIHITAIPDKK